ncbi:type VII secretion protein EccE [Mycobacterium sp.]|uniref:type VII secretion protein EccE n=1 Tax=Mycobacterium sp. TaxID=1785 RepID=UPI00126FC25D|nr:type VII secretion protein EccE [Mycobacterium sp.]KAA8969631.1 MAG: type VII secretion protein EccE [Mycobacterium sp.]
MKSPRALSLPTGRATLVLLAVVPAAMAHPWHSPRERWVLGIAIAAVVVSLARWRGLFATTILRRRIAMVFRNRRGRPAHGSGMDVRTTALLRITPADNQPDLLPLPLIARYLDRYGIHAYALRVTSHDTDSASQRQTWIGITLSAVDNLVALRARAPRLPLHETAEVAARRLADHLRETGWTTVLVGPDEVPPLAQGRESWRGIRAGSDDYWAAYQVGVDAGLPETLSAIEAYPARARWTVLEIADDGAGPTLAVGCAFRTATAATAESAPLAGLSPHSGNHGPALTALHPGSARRLDGHRAFPVDLLARLRWASTARQPHSVAVTSG